MGYTDLEKEVAVSHLREHYAGALPLPDNLDGFVLSSVSGGLANSNYRLHAPAGSDGFPRDGVLLKLCDEKGAAELESQAAVVASLQAAGFPTPRLYPTGSSGSAPGSDPDPKTFVSWIGSVGVLVFDFVVGESPDRVDSALRARSVGAALAALHNARVPTGVEFQPFAMGIAQMRPFLDKVNSTCSDYPEHTNVAADPFVDRLRSAVGRLAGRVDADDLPRGLVHGDLFADNMIFGNDGGDLVAVLDFEEVCLAPTALDVAMTIVGCFYNTSGEADPALVSAFLDGYRASREITEKERSVARDMVEYSMLSIAFWRFRQFNVVYPGHENKDRHLEMVARMDRLDGPDAFVCKW